jgi:trimethylamine:corrinoid methyltransferase-like protein
MKHMKDGAFMPEVADRETRQTWSEGGGLDAYERAMKIARDTLARDRNPLLTREVDERLRGVFPGMVTGNLKLPEG